MSAQLELFNAPKARRNDPDTSRAAAAAVGDGVEGVIMALFDWGREMGCAPMLSDDELCRGLSWLHPPTVKTARSRLSKRGLLVDSGERRPSTRGRSQIVWRMP